MRYPFLELVFALVLIILYLCIGGCSSVTQKSDSNTFYKRDISIKVNGKKGIGILIAPRADKYVIEIKAKSKLDLFTLNSCHREITKEEAGENGIFGDKKKVKLTYIPSKGIEDGQSCTILLGGYEKKGRHSWGFIAFEHPDLIVRAKLRCNGETYLANGVSGCQSKAGTIQEILFDEKMRISPDKNCPMPMGDGKTFRWKMVGGFCLYAFMDKSGELHQLNTLGSEDILIRSD